MKSKSEAEKNLKICFKNFLKDESYRHISIMDSTHQLFELKFDKQDNAYFFYPLRNFSATENPDTLIISDTENLTNNSLEALGGDDLVIDNSHCNHDINGEEGNDVITAMEGGNKNLSGNEGEDQLFSGPGNDVLIGGTGNDWLSGGEGDDRYFVSRSDGHTTIEDSGGTDTLFLRDISVDELRFTTSRRRCIYHFEK